MSLGRRPLVALYALGSTVVLSAFGALTVFVLRQQADHARAVAEALHQEDVRTALWRMESRVGSLLALTTSRVALVQQAPGSYAANALRGFDNAINPVDPPSGKLQQELIAAADQAFTMACSIAPSAEGPDAGGSAEATQRAVTPTWTVPEQQDIANRGLQRSLDEYDRRAGVNQQTQLALSNAGSARDSEFLIGPLASRWDRSGAELGLQFARRIQGAGGASHESYRIEWAELSRLLLAEITDLFPDAQLAPIELGGSDEAASTRALRLAAIPARLIVPPPQPARQLPTAYVWTLGGAWAALLGALAIGGFALRASFAYGDKHRRFTHAVTHELRTPLTTFRMYSEMLARDMVPASSRAEYLAALETESARLAHLIDNVLRYARLEDGRHAHLAVAIGASDLIERCVPELARTCASHSARLDVQDLTAPDARLETDPDAVLQILSNLVENACKYGCTDATPIVLRGSLQDRWLRLDVSDSGPGVPPAVARSIFEPFDRGGRDSADRAQGVGLGLSLSRALAAELGGTLTLEPAEHGATFRLSLPL